MLFKSIESFIPVQLVFMHPDCYLAEWFTSKGNKNLTALSFSLYESGSLEEFEMFRHGVQRRVEPPGNVQESSGSAGQLPDDRAPRRVGHGYQYVCQLVHAYYTVRCNVFVGAFF